MANVNGKLLKVASPTDLFPSEQGTVTIALCGYGSYVPRTPGGTIVDLEYQITPADPSNAMWSVEVTGNDEIRPAGTYYTLTYKDANGDIAQTMAFVFLHDGAYDVDTDLDPFDPSLPMMPLPPLILDELDVVAAFDTMVFDGTAYTAFKTTLHSNVLHPTFTNMQPGHLYTFIILQDDLGGWQFVWGSTVHNGTMVALDQFARTVQTFIADQDGQLYAISGGAYS